MIMDLREAKRLIHEISINPRMLTRQETNELFEFLEDRLSEEDDEDEDKSPDDIIVDLEIAGQEVKLVIENPGDDENETFRLKLKDGEPAEELELEVSGWPLKVKVIE